MASSTDPAALAPSTTRQVALGHDFATADLADTIDYTPGQPTGTATRDQVVALLRRQSAVMGYVGWRNLTGADDEVGTADNRRRYNTDAITAYATVTFTVALPQGDLARYLSAYDPSRARGIATEGEAALLLSRQPEGLTLDWTIDRPVTAPWFPARQPATNIPSEDT